MPPKHFFLLKAVLMGKEELRKDVLHWADACVHEEEPVVYFVALAGAGWVGDFVMFLIVLLDEVLHYGS